MNDQYPKPRVASHDEARRGALTDAIARLAAGQRGLRVPDDSLEAVAFNALARRLDQAESGPEDTSSGRLPDHLWLPDPTQGRSVYVAVVGVDRFAHLRRQIGGQMADRILEAMSWRLRRVLPLALAGRTGGANIEFVFPADDAVDARAQLERLLGALEQRLEIEGQTFDLSVSIGYAPRTGGEEFAVENAALALAQAQSGHIRLAVYREEDRAAAEARLDLLRDLRQAIANGELALVYQPKYRCRTGGIDVAEALIRWKHPLRGMVPPDDFIGLAEETGLITDLTKWVLSRALADQAHLLAAGHALTIHINVSGRVLPDAAFAQWALETIKRDAVGVIGFEITETAVIDEPERALRNLKSFADAGVKIAIDDYGSGLSSLAYLKELPAHELKIDRMFISSLTTSHRDPLLVRSTIDLAHALEMEVTAEGVDNAGALALLTMMGCDLIQGYLISKPIELGDLELFLAKPVEIKRENPFISRFVGNAT